MRQSRAARGVLVGALMTVAAMTSPPLFSDTPGLTESELKAVFLLRLPQFVTWPDGQVADVFCVAEAPELSRLLTEMLVDDARGRAVRELRPTETMTGCDVVFGNDATQLPAGAAVQPMLRVNDQPGLCARRWHGRAAASRRSHWSGCEPVGPRVSRFEGEQ